jgi:tRNA 2-selenouridine synthase SelU
MEFTGFEEMSRISNSVKLPNPAGIEDILLLDIRNLFNFFNEEIPSGIDEISLNESVNSSILMHFSKSMGNALKFLLLKLT